MSKILFLKLQKLHWIPNLLLQNKTVRASAPNFLKSSEKMGGNQWDALRASHILARQKPLSSVLVPDPRVELGTPASSGQRSLPAGRQVPMSYVL